MPYGADGGFELPLREYAGAGDGTGGADWPIAQTRVRVNGTVERRLGTAAQSAPKASAAMQRRERFRPTAPNQVWILDFVADQLSDGRRFRALTVPDILIREIFAIEVGQKLKGEDVVAL